MRQHRLGVGSSVIKQNVRASGCPVQQGDSMELSMQCISIKTQKMTSYPMFSVAKCECVKQPKVKMQLVPVNRKRTQLCYLRFVG